MSPCNTNHEEKVSKHDVLLLPVAVPSHDTSKPRAESELSELNLRNSWLLNDGMVEGIRFPQKRPKSGEVR